MAGGLIAMNGETVSYPPLRLRAEDEEDLAVISAILQDALVAVGEMAFLQAGKRFVLVVNRFRWERLKDASGPSFERIFSALSFEKVQGVRYRGFQRSVQDRLLQILALHMEGNAVVIEFSGESCLRLEVEGVLCRLEDLGEPWRTPWCPRHPIDSD